MKILMSIFLCLILVSCSGEKTNATEATSTISRNAPTQENSEIQAEEPFETSAMELDDPFLAQRLDMVAKDIEARGISDPDVLHAMETVPRHEFVPADYLDLAYSDRPLPIGYGQTISQPYIVAWMTELLELKEGDKVLEIGTGSGYQAAILAELNYVDVFSIEIVPELAEIAKNRLVTLGYEDVTVTQGDGYYGWEEHQPFDAIIVTAAPDHLPQPLANQLAEGGKMVIPIGPQGGFQTLWVFEKSGDDLSARNLGLVSFVPFTRDGVGDEELKP